MGFAGRPAWQGDRAMLAVGSWMHRSDALAPTPLARRQQLEEPPEERDETLDDPTHQTYESGQQTADRSEEAPKHSHALVIPEPRHRIPRDARQGQWSAPRHRVRRCRGPLPPPPEPAAAGAPPGASTKPAQVRVPGSRRRFDPCPRVAAPHLAQPTAGEILGGRRRRRTWRSCAGSTTGRAARRRDPLRFYAQDIVWGLSRARTAFLYPTPVFTDTRGSGNAGAKPLAPLVRSSCTPRS